MIDAILIGVTITIGIIAFTLSIVAVLVVIFTVVVNIYVTMLFGRKKWTKNLKET